MAVDEAIRQEQMQMAEELLFSGKKLPSFAKGFFAGLYDSKRVFPFPEPTEAQEIELKEYLEKF
ncbi:MAG: hypothetical protein RLZZ303_3649, partial [Candidatus Hydrogenedentota bacterium]